MRDRNSYELIHRTDLFPNAKSVTHIPDMVCSMDFQNLSSEKRSGVLVCMRNDIEGVLEEKERNKLYACLLSEEGKLWTLRINGAIQDFCHISAK